MNPFIKSLWAFKYDFTLSNLNSLNSSYTLIAFLTSRMSFLEPRTLLFSMMSETWISLRELPSIYNEDCIDFMRFALRSLVVGFLKSAASTIPSSLPISIDKFIIRLVPS